MTVQEISPEDRRYASCEGGRWEVDGSFAMFRRCENEAIATFFKGDSTEMASFCLECAEDAADGFRFFVQAERKK